MITECVLWGVLATVGGALDSQSPPLQKDLSLRLEPGQIWRQAIDCDAEVAFAGGTEQSWQFQCVLRLECVGIDDDGLYEVDARFIDWWLTLDGGAYLLEWKDEQFRKEGKLPWSEEAAESCRQIWRAWADGLRGADLRFRVGRNGQIQHLRGLEGLRETVESGVASCETVPESFGQLFGRGRLCA